MKPYLTTEDIHRDTVDKFCDFTKSKTKLRNHCTNEVITLLRDVSELKDIP